MIGLRDLEDMFCDQNGLARSLHRKRREAFILMAFLVIACIVIRVGLALASTSCLCLAISPVHINPFMATILRGGNTIATTLWKHSCGRITAMPA